MSRVTPRKAGAGNTVRARIASDLQLLADLHDHEPDREAVVALWARCYDGLLEAVPFGPMLRNAISRFCDSLTEIPTCFDASAGDALLTDFRRICLTVNDCNEWRNSVTRESDAPYLHFDTTPADQWASPSDTAAEPGACPGGADLASRLRHLAHLVAETGVAAPADTLRHYLQRHVRTSVDHFAADAAAHSRTRFYQELGGLTTAYVQELEQRFATGGLDGRRSPSPHMRPVPAPEPVRAANPQHPLSTTGGPWNAHTEA